MVLCFIITIITLPPRCRYTILDNYNVVYLTYACKLACVELYTTRNTRSTNSLAL